MTSITTTVDGLCRHDPQPENRWCHCGALVLAGTHLRGVCGHERRFPPGFAWAPDSWCSDCRRFRNFGAEPLVYTPPPIPPFWLGEFTVTADRPLSVVDLGRALAWPNVSALHRRLGTVDRNYWYRWRSRGLTWGQADVLAVNANLHPIDVWGRDWEDADG